MTETTKNPAHYINNQEFLEALIEYKKSIRRAKRKKEPIPVVPEYIGDCFIKIANRLAFKNNFINYSFRDEMILDAIENCLIYIDNFDPKKSTNPFAYFTQISYFAFIRRIQKEKRQLHTKYRYIESLDLDSVIRQIGDEGDYDNSFLNYLKKQADSAEKELEAVKNETKIVKKPKYLDVLDQETTEIQKKKTKITTKKAAKKKSKKNS